jgi:hypothetical protein
VLVAGPQAVQEFLGRQDRDVAVGLAVRLVLAGRPGEQQPVERRPGLLGQPAEVVLGQLRRRLGGTTPLQRAGAEGLGPPGGWVAQLAAEEADDRVGQVVRARVLGEVLRCDPGADQMEGQVTDDLL